jgi:CheY-like chemotaxis protein
MARVSRRARVLIVDDEAMVRRFLRRILGQADYEILEAGDGLQALALAENHGPVDVVVSDIRMPNMDGRALAAYLAALNPPIPVLLISAYEEPAALGPVLAKPFRSEELLDRVRQILIESGRFPAGS